MQAADVELMSAMAAQCAKDNAQELNQLRNLRARKTLEPATRLQVEDQIALREELRRRCALLRRVRKDASKFESMQQLGVLTVEQQQVFKKTQRRLRTNLKKFRALQDDLNISKLTAIEVARSPADVQDDPALQSVLGLVQDCDQNNKSELQRLRALSKRSSLPADVRTAVDEQLAVREAMNSTCRTVQRIVQDYQLLQRLQAKDPLDAEERKNLKLVTKRLKAGLRKWKRTPPPPLRLSDLEDVSYQAPAQAADVEDDPALQNVLALAQDCERNDNSELNRLRALSKRSSLPDDVRTAVEEQLAVREAMKTTCRTVKRISTDYQLLQRLKAKDALNEEERTTVKLATNRLKAALRKWKRAPPPPLRLADLKEVTYEPPDRFADVAGQVRATLPPAEQGKSEADVKQFLRACSADHADALARLRAQSARSSLTGALRRNVLAQIDVHEKLRESCAAGLRALDYEADAGSDPKIRKRLASALRKLTPLTSARQNLLRLEQEYEDLQPKDISPAEFQAAMIQQHVAGNLGDAARARRALALAKRRKIRAKFKSQLVVPTLNAEQQGQVQTLRKFLGDRTALEATLKDLQAALLFVKEELKDEKAAGGSAKIIQKILRQKLRSEAAVKEVQQKLAALDLLANIQSLQRNKKASQLKSALKKLQSKYEMYEIPAKIKAATYDLDQEILKLERRIAKLQSPKEKRPLKSKLTRLKKQRTKLARSVRSKLVASRPRAAKPQQATPPTQAQDAPQAPRLKRKAAQKAKTKFKPKKLKKANKFCHKDGFRFITSIKTCDK